MAKTQSNVGWLGEIIAELEYIKRGYRVLGRNWRAYGGKQIGEIDLVVTNFTQLVFVEVKTRRSDRFGTGFEGVNYWKRRKLVRAAEVLLARWPEYCDIDWRFDVVQVNIDKQGHSAIMLENVIEDLD